VSSRQHRKRRVAALHKRLLHSLHARLFAKRTLNAFFAGELLIITPAQGEEKFNDWTARVLAPSDMKNVRLDRLEKYIVDLVFHWRIRAIAKTRLGKWLAEECDRQIYKLLTAGEIRTASGIILPSGFIP
jgi:hypothetical protein